MTAPLQQSQAPPALRGKGPGRLLRKAVRREVAVPAAIALAGLSVAVLTKSLLAYADWIVNRGLSSAEVGWIALLEIVPVIAQTLPFALLIGVLVALGRLKGDLELLAIESLGVSRLQLVPSVAAVAVLGWILASVLSLWAAPASRAALEARLERIQRDSPGALLYAGQATEFDGRQLLAREVSADGKSLSGVLLWMPDLGEAVFGERGRLESDPEAVESLELVLEDVALLGTASAGTGGQHVEVETFRTRLDLTPDDTAPGDHITAESTLSLWQERRVDLDADEQRRREAELHRRVAHPVATLLLGLLAAPLALARNRFSRSSGAVAGLVLTAGYYGLLQFGEALLGDPSVPVFMAVWLAPAVVAVLVAVLLERLRRSAFDEEKAHKLTTPSVSEDRPVGVRGVLDRYVLGVYLGAAALSVAALFIAYLLIDVLERLEWFARHQADLTEIAHFYLARGPLLAARVLPMGLLAGAALTVSLLAVRNELVALQACGIRLGRALLPIVVASAVLVPLDFFLNDAVITRTNAWADRIKVERIKDRTEGASTEAWYRADGQLVRASLSGIRGGLIPDLVVYELSEHGLPSARIGAREARRISSDEEGSVWELIDAEAILISERGLERVDAPAQYALGAARRAEIDPMHHSAGSLAGEIRSAEEQGFLSLPLKVAFHRKLSAPVACILLPAMALLIAVRSRRTPSPARNLVACAALGVAYLLVGDVAASLGYGGQISPAAAGWAPPSLALFGVLALMVRPRA